MDVSWLFRPYNTCVSKWRHERWSYNHVTKLLFTSVLIGASWEDWWQEDSCLKSNRMDIWHHAEKAAKHGSAYVTSWRGTYAWTCSSMSRLFLSHAQSQSEAFIYLNFVVCWAVITYNMSPHTYTLPPLDNSIHSWGANMYTGLPNALQNPQIAYSCL